MDRPRVRAKFDSADETFTYGELDALLGTFYAEQPSEEKFAAAEVLGLRHEQPATTAAPRHGS